MKIAIVSDIHANLAALEAFPEKNFDQLWCLGDLVDYGPRPHQVIQWVRHHATAAVRGNHDQAVGFGVDPQCSLPYKHLASETMRYTREVCTKDDFEFLRNLPVQKEAVVGTNEVLSGPCRSYRSFFGYRPQDSELWEKEIQWINADVLLVGHTHTPFIRQVGGCTIVNPGSLGQPKTGRPLACYAIWEDGEISLKEYNYPLQKTIRQIRRCRYLSKISSGIGSRPRDRRAIGSNGKLSGIAPRIRHQVCPDDWRSQLFRGFHLRGVERNHGTIPPGTRSERNRCRDGGRSGRIAGIWP
jgi:putative phosphoesterase